jgi:hypothetical protein
MGMTNGTGKIDDKHLHRLSAVDQSLLYRWDTGLLLDSFFHLRDLGWIIRTLWSPQHRDEGGLGVGDYAPSTLVEQ